MKYETCKEIEIAIAKFFDKSSVLIVPNVSWGFLLHEADLLILSTSDYAYEVEIKISRSDIVRDQSKHHGHVSDKIRLLWFAIPEKLKDDIGLIQERAGILSVGTTGRVFQIREPAVNTAATKLTPEQKFKVARLGALRIWRLKRKILGMENSA